MFEASDLSVKSGGRLILEDVSFTAQPGQVTAVAGPNGSGKTTLLRRLSGDLGGPGMVSIGGRDLTKIPLTELAAWRGVLAQSVRVGFAFTLREIVRMGHEAGQLPLVREITEEALAEQDLLHKADRLFSELSGGEQARGQLARVRAQIWEPVFKGRPSWLLVDEPVAALDIGHQLQVMALLRRFADQGGGVIAVMHDLNLTAMHADRIVLMRGGRVAATGPVEKVMTDRVLSEAYQCPLHVRKAPETGMWLLPQAAG